MFKLIVGSFLLLSSVNVWAVEIAVSAEIDNNCDIAIVGVGTIEFGGDTTFGSAALTATCNHTYTVDITSASTDADKNYWALTHTDEAGVDWEIRYDIAFNNTNGSIDGLCSSTSPDGHDDGHISGCQFNHITDKDMGLGVRLQDIPATNPSGSYVDTLTITVAHI